MRNVYVVTHPEVQHHVDGVVGRWHDSRLTAVGTADAERIADALAAVPSDVDSVSLHSSDLERTMAVARRIADRLEVPVVPDGDLREKSYGEAEGRPTPWLDERFVVPPAGGDRMGHDEGVAGAKTKHEFATRIDAATARALAGDAEHVVIATHGFALTFVVATWSRLPVSPWAG